MTGNASEMPELGRLLNEPYHRRAGMPPLQRRRRGRKSMIRLVKRLRPSPRSSRHRSRVPLQPSETDRLRHREAIERRRMAVDSALTIAGRAARP